MSVRLSVVIPAYNEERMIAETLRRVNAYLSHEAEPAEIIVSTDGSKDHTDELVRRFIIEHPDRSVKHLTDTSNHGKGAAVRRGVEAASGRYILITDADLSTPLKECEVLIRALDEGADIAIGSRALKEPGVEVRQSLKRHISGRIFNFFVKCFVIGDFKDTQCGFKCFKREAAKTLFAKSRIDGFSFDVEVLYLAKKMNFRTREVAVMWSQGRRSAISLFRDSFLMLKDLFKIRMAA